MAMSRPVDPPVHANRTGPYSEDAGGDKLRINAFNHDDVNVAFDLLSNRRFPNSADLAVLGTLVFGGPTRDSIDVMIPDCLLPPVGGDVRVDLRHLVTLSLGPAMDMSDCVPAPNMDRALCPNSLAPTLGLQRREYPLLAKWKNINDTHCPECA